MVFFVALGALFSAVLNDMAKTDKKLHFPVGVCLICLFAVSSVKGRDFYAMLR